MTEYELGEAAEEELPEAEALTTNPDRTVVNPCGERNPQLHPATTQEQQQYPDREDVALTQQI